MAFLSEQTSPARKIKIRNLKKQFQGEADSISVLDKLDLDIEPGTIIAIEGASGSGKSTLLNILGTMEKPTSGQVQYGDLSLDSISNQEKEAFRAKNLGFIFQHHHLLPDFSLLENTMMPLLISHRPWPQSRRQSEELLQRVGLGERMNHYTSQISGGELSRASVARALIGNKTLILADEPTGNLDRHNSGILVDLLWKLQAKLKFTMVIVTHDRELSSQVSLRYRLVSGSLESIH